jgi:hypothetical protein
MSDSSSEINRRATQKEQIEKMSHSSIWPSRSADHGPARHLTCGPSLLFYFSSQIFLPLQIMSAKWYS